MSKLGTTIEWQGVSMRAVTLTFWNLATAWHALFHLTRISAPRRPWLTNFAEIKTCDSSVKRRRDVMVSSVAAYTITVKDMLHHSDWASSTKSAELTVHSSTCLTSWHDVLVDRKLNESQTGDSTHLLMHSASNVTWSLWIIPTDIRTPARLVHSIPDSQPPRFIHCVSKKSSPFCFSQ